MEILMYWKKNPQKNMFSCTHLHQGLVPEYAPECSIVIYSNPKQIAMGLH